MRWLFLSNILNNVAEIQTFPQQHLPPQHPHYDVDLHPHHPDGSPMDVTQREAHWRNQCLQTILSYPPGSHRLLMTDAYRVDLVQKLAQKITAAQECLRHHHLAQQNKKERKRIGLFGVRDSQAKSNNEAADATTIVNEGLDQKEANITSSSSASPLDKLEKDLDTDTERIQDTNQQSASETPGDLTTSSSTTNSNPPTPPLPGSEHHVDHPIHSQMADGSHVDVVDSRQTAHDANMAYHPPPSTESISVEEARIRLGEVRHYLPQLVSAVLKSPLPVDDKISNPIHVLRQLLINRCLQDPSWGIELCWLLEADVGRAWKRLLEHPQQTGRRLLFILPAEKAAVLAKIGEEKAAAFDLLQEAEQATAFGYTATDPSDPLNQINHQMILSNTAQETSRTPSSLSQRRCSHFGDTMHFIDRLTKLSMDLKKVIPSDRNLFMFEGLRELNRRIRRRMVTKGEMSLDLEDHYGPHGWPQVEELREDMLQHSVHFPLIPQDGEWPTGEPGHVPSRDNPHVVRVLNVVVDESKLLSSRERCPFLVQLEVADTGLEGHDARLYTSGANVGSTIEEALSMGTRGGGNIADSKPLLSSEPQSIGQESRPPSAPHTLELSRGGHTSDQPYPHQSSYPGGSNDEYSSQSQDPNNVHDDHFQEDYDNVAYGYPDVSERIRQHQVEQLHHHMHRQQQLFWQQQEYLLQQHQSVQTQSLYGRELLDHVFGSPSAEKCREIKDSSPYGRVAGWRLASFIVKAGEDIRREALVMQVISMLRGWFEEEIHSSFRPFMRLYTIMCVGGDAGLVECLSDATSIDEVKKKTDNFVSLRDFFERAFGRPGSEPVDGEVSFETAQDNFLRSLVGYSLVCYILQIKDRHNANILLDRFGHIMHIDFGFVLGDTPKMGKVPIFSERAPFKLSAEFWDVLGGWNTRSGGLGVKFCKMFEKAFACASKHSEEIAALVETTMLGLNYDVRSAKVMANGVRSRLRMKGPPGSPAQQQFIVGLVSDAQTSWQTSTYDWLQKNMNGYQ